MAIGYPNKEIKNIYKYIQDIILILTRVNHRLFSLPKPLKAHSNFPSSTQNCYPL